MVETTICKVFREGGFTPTNAELIHYLFTMMFENVYVPLKFNWTPIVTQKMKNVTFANKYDYSIVILSFLEAFPSARKNVPELIALLEFTKDDAEKWFDRSITIDQVIHLYVSILDFLLVFLNCLANSPQVQFGPSIFKPAPVTGYAYVDDFYTKTRDASDDLGNMTKELSHNSFTALASTLNSLAPLMANLAYFNPDAKHEAAKSLAALDKDRAIFDELAASGKLKGLAKSFAEILPDSQKTYTPHEYNYLLDRKKREITGQEASALASNAKSDAHHGFDIWLLKSQEKVGKLEAKQQAIMRKLFPFGFKHDKLLTTITRLLFAADFAAPTVIAGVPATALLPIQFALRQVSRPEIYLVLSRILSHLPEQPTMQAYIDRVYHLINDTNRVLKPFLPLLNKMLGVTYPLWSKSYRKIMAFISRTANIIFGYLFPSQRTITVTTRQFEEAAGALLQLIGLGWHTYEVFSFQVTIWILRAIKMIIQRYGLKIVLAIVAAV